jgi:hypothetical protein
MTAPFPTPAAAPMCRTPGCPHPADPSDHSRLTRGLCPYCADFRDQMKRDGDEAAYAENRERSGVDDCDESDNDDNREG